MRIFTSKYIIRTVLLLVSFQFISPAFIAEVDEEKRNGYALMYSKHHPSSVCSLFEITENENEEEERDKFISLDFFHTSKLHQKLLANTLTTPEVKDFLLAISGLTLFQLHCNYRI